MATAVESSTTMEAATAVESFTAVKAASATSAINACAIAVIVATDKAMSGTASVTVAWPVTVAWSIAKVRTIAVSGMAIIAVSVESATVVSVEPRAGANKHAAYKVARPVVAVWRASIRIVVVVAISTDRCWSETRVPGTYSNTHSNLCMRVSRSEK